MAFDEVQFPPGISYGVSGGPERRTEVATLGSGGEERNARWFHSRRKWNAGYGIKQINHFHEIIAFFEARNARLRGFRFKDWTDYKSGLPGAATVITMLDQNIGTGDGVTAAFPLRKRYTSGAITYDRPITKPVSGTVVIAVAGVSETGFTVDLTTGIVTFGSGDIPSAAQAITAGYEFDVPVRFDTDYLSLSVGEWEQGRIPNIPIIELRLAA